MAISQSYFDGVQAQRRQVRRSRAHLDQAEEDFHAAAEAWEAAAEHQEDGELLYAYKRATVWLAHVAAIHQRMVESQDGMLARMFVRDEGVG